MAQTAAIIWADGPTSEPFEPEKSEMRAWGKLVEQQMSLVNSPLTYDATGDGTTDDATNYALAEAANDNIFLPSDTVFNLGSAIPTKPVYGPGKMKKGAVELGGYQLQVDAYRSTIFLSPSDYSADVGFPTAGYNKGVLFGAGTRLQNTMNRFVGVGTRVLRNAISVDRSEAIGDGNMEFMLYGERNTALGSANMQWAGTSLALAQTTHPWWIETGGFAPGAVGWDFGGMEARNPGIGTKIAAFSAWAAASTDVARSVSVGRDAMGGNVKTLNDVAIGYRALAGFNTFENVAVGSNAFYQGVFQQQSVAVGYLAGQFWQEGQRNVVIGRAAGAQAVRGSYNFIAGAFAGTNVVDSDDNLFLGYAAGNTLSGTDLNDLLVIGNRNRAFMLTGDFIKGALGVGIDPTAIRCAGPGIHIFGSSFGASEAASGALDDLILETSGNTGMTIRSGATALGQLGFARPGQPTRGIIGFDHNSDQMRFTVATNTMLAFNGAQMAFFGGTPVTKPTGVAVTAAGVHAALVSLGLIAA